MHLNVERLAFMALVCLAVAQGAPGATTTVRSYGLPGGGSLELQVPIRWQEEIGWSEEGERPTITFRPDEGASFSARITVLTPDADAGAAFSSSDRLRSLVADSARASLGVDGSADLHLERIGDEIRVMGWYYSVVDESMPDPPPEGTYRVLTQGASAASGFVLTATVLTQKQWGVDLNDALALLRTARVVDAPGDAWRVPGRIVKARGAIGQRYDLPLPADFEIESRAPLQARHAATGALLTIDVVDRASQASSRDELRRIEAELERRSPGAILLRRRGMTRLAGRAAADVEAVDELRDESVRMLALPLADATLVLSWRVHPDRAQEAGRVLDGLLRDLTLTAE